MTKTLNAIVRDPRGGYLIATPGGKEIPVGLVREGFYVRDDNGKQICVGANYTGNTLIYYDDERLARGCRARLYKTMKGYEAAKQRLAETDPWDCE